MRKTRSNTNIFDTDRLSVISRDADNQNLTKIHEKVHRYLVLKET
ncbi:MAG: hypothetical protein WC525_05950 [Candidatus Thermoplasmatota archaeon]